MTPRDGRRGMRYLSIDVPGRANVREPLNPPEMRLVKDNGRIAKVELSEHDLYAMLAHIAEALKRLEARRGATMRADPPTSTANQPEEVHPFAASARGVDD